MLKTAFSFSVCLSLAACGSSTPVSTSATSAGSGAATSTGSTGRATVGGSSAGTTGSVAASTGGSASAASSGSTSAGATATGTGTGTGGGTTGTANSWTEVGSIPDLGGGNVFVSDLLPLPGPSSLPEVLFTESFGGVVGVFQTYWDGGYVTPELIFDGGQGGFYNLQGTSWEQGQTNLLIAIDTQFHLITLEQVDGGAWAPFPTNVSPIPSGGMALAFDQGTGEAWIAGLSSSVVNGSNVNLYRLDDAGVKVAFPSVAAASINVAPCTKPDGGALLCVVYITGFSDQTLWVQTFDPVTQTIGTAGRLFDSADAGFDGFASGCAVTEVTPGTVVAMAAGLGPGTPVQNTEQFAWASVDLTALGTAVAPNLYASDAGSPQSVPALWTWNANAFLLFRETSTFPEAEVGVSLGGPEVPAFPLGAGVTNATAIPAGYTDSSDTAFVVLPTTAQGGKITIFSLSP